MGDLYDAALEVADAHHEARIDDQIDRLHGDGAAAELARAMADGEIKVDGTPKRPLVQFLVERYKDGDFTVECDLFPELYVCEGTLPAALRATAAQIEEIAMAHVVAEIDRRLAGER